MRCLRPPYKSQFNTFLKNSFSLIVVTESAECGAEHGVSGAMGGLQNRPKPIRGIIGGSTPPYHYHYHYHFHYHYHYHYHYRLFSLFIKTVRFSWVTEI